MSRVPSAYDPRLSPLNIHPNDGLGGPGGSASAGGPGSGSGREPAELGPPIKSGPLPKVPPAMVLYLSCGDEAGPGQVFQVNEHGAVYGMVNLPYTATGMALHRDHGLICVTPRDGGKIMRIDETGKVAVVSQRDVGLPHPVDVAVGAESDTIVVADNVAHALLATSTEGGKARLYHRFKGPRPDDERMSVAVTTDKHVIFGGNGDPGVFRFSGDDYSAARPPLLPGGGGVAADTASLKWAATQEPDLLYVFEGEELIKKFKLPGNKRLYCNGLVSFAPAGAVVVAARDPDRLEDDPWLIAFQTKDTDDKEQDEIRDLFKWNRARMVDFVVGPRMLWDRRSPKEYRSTY